MIARLTKSVNFAPAVVTLAATAGVGGAWLWQRRRMLTAAAEATKQAAIAMRTPLLDAYEKAGFERRTVVVGSGEEVPYLCRPFAATAASPRRVLVFLHGMTADAVLSAAAVLPLAEQAPPDVEILVPEAAGHGERRAWTLGMKPRWTGYTRDDHVADVEAFLVALRRADGRTPIDVCGYSMGGATAYQLAARSESLKIGRVALLAPGLLVAPEQYAMTLAVERSGKVADCVYNYRTEAEAVEMLRLVGYAEAHHAKLAPIMAWARQALYPRDFWWLMWRGFGGVDGFAEVAPAIAAKRALLAEDGARLRAAGTPVLVVQGSEERVIHEEVPAWVAEAVGGACEVRMLDGQGHRGCPADATRNFLTEAAGEAAGWLAKS